jgi:phosphohistidine phosphatase
VKLYLVQHGEAKSEKEDPKRPLTDRGRAEVLKVARFLEKAGVEIDQIWHSGKARAKGTAQMIAETLKVEELCEELEGLTPNDPAEPIVKRIDQIKPEDEIENLMIVSHLPLLQKLSSTLLSGPSAGTLVQFHMGGVVCLERQNRGAWQFVWAVVPELL